MYMPSYHSLCIGDTIKSFWIIQQKVIICLEHVRIYVDIFVCYGREINLEIAICEVISKQVEFIGNMVTLNV